MQLTPEISFRSLDPTPALTARIEERVARLDRYHPHIMSCRVMVESRHRHQHKGKLYHVRVDVTVPGGELVVNREPADNHAHEDAYVAIRDAFEAIERQLESHLQRRRGEVKAHESPSLPGRVGELAWDHGRIETSDGRSIYFHRNSVAGGDFERLEVGSPVHFVEASGNEGPQASSVMLAT
ncbi:MAG: ribosome-associated translation inhibitor RaiA [Chromatiaceae bacterium]|jgi:ribosomal subunit interface protein|nr:ribosome-associated translation inhibitor RaiA [Chromatiaceae bacterium]